MRASLPMVACQSRLLTGHKVQEPLDDPVEQGRLPRALIIQQNSAAEPRQSATSSDGCWCRSYGWAAMSKGLSRPGYFSQSGVKWSASYSLITVSGVVDTTKVTFSGCECSLRGRTATEGRHFASDGTTPPSRRDRPKHQLF